MSMRAGSSSGLFAMTVTDSLTVPTGNVALTTAVWPTDNVMPLCSNRLNPWSSPTTL